MNRRDIFISLIFISLDESTDTFSPTSPNVAPLLCYALMASARCLMAPVTSIKLHTENTYVGKTMYQQKCKGSNSWVSHLNQ